jgi:hypothetical protein
MTADLLPRLQSALEGHYIVERELGWGGMATVYLAHDLDIGVYNIALAPPLVELYRGQAAEGLGDRDAAREHYSRAVRWLRQADPELVPVREEGRAALARLTGEAGTQ